MGDFFGGAHGVLMLVPVLLIVLWGAACLWAVAKLLRMDIALVSRVLWAVAILAFPLAGLLAFLLLADRTPQMERELGIRHV